MFKNQISSQDMNTQVVLVLTDINTDTFVSEPKLWVNPHSGTLVVRTLEIELMIATSELGPTSV